MVQVIGLIFFFLLSTSMSASLASKDPLQELANDLENLTAESVNALIASCNKLFALIGITEFGLQLYSPKYQVSLHLPKSSEKLALITSYFSCLKKEIQKHFIIVKSETFGDFEAQKNTADTVDDLLIHAKNGYALFMENLKQIKAKLPSVSIVDNDQVFKSRDSLQGKVARDLHDMTDKGEGGITEQRKKVVQKISDALRSTVIVENLEDCKDAVKEIVSIFPICKVKNFWQEYEQTYLGINIKVVLQISSEITLLAEIQVHSKYLLEVKDEASHYIYEFTRAMSSGVFEGTMLKLANQLIFAAELTNEFEKSETKKAITIKCSDQMKQETKKLIVKYTKTDP